jgi:2-hydroxy-3-oxopropionate reductase
VLFREHGVARGLAPGKVVIDMGSISPTATKQFAEKIRLVQVPRRAVSGGE